MIGLPAEILAQLNRNPAFIRKAQIERDLRIELLIKLDVSKRDRARCIVCARQGHKAKPERQSDSDVQSQTSGHSVVDALRVKSVRELLDNLSHETDLLVLPEAIEMLQHRAFLNVNINPALHVKILRLDPFEYFLGDNDAIGLSKLSGISEAFRQYSWTTSACMSFAAALQRFQIDVFESV